jgi:hypothetical protein
VDSTRYDWLALNAAADLARLGKFIPSEYAPDAVGQKLAAGISDAVKGILIESNYVDKDYRSTYYHFYAKKGQYYRSDCVRLHFFDGTVSFEKEKLRLRSSDQNDLTSHYFGYMVLRPTGIATIGRTVLSPDIRSGACKLIIDGHHKAHLLGHKLKVQGFPSMDQHIDIAVCAHVACWSILRHYSERYAVYREFLTHDITMMAQEFDPGGLVPSLGLHVSHAERVFQEANTFPLLISKETGGDPVFCRQLGSYIESGFPLFAAMSSRAHAVVVVGHEWRTPTPNATPGISYAWDEIAQVAVIDDNHLPYLTIPVAGGAAPYSVDDIDAFIVPLPEKIYYPADAVDRLAPTLFKLNSLVDLPPRDDSVVRYFLTTASALRSFVRERESEFAPELLQKFMTLPLTQFVWIVEFATRAQWAVRQVAARAVIDATASLREVLPLWILHTDKAAIVMDRKKPMLVTKPPMTLMNFQGVGHSGFTRMEQNLRHTSPK